MIWVLIAIVVIGAVSWTLRRNHRVKRLQQAQSVALELLPEIRALMDSADPAGASGGEPAPARHYETCQQRLPQVFANEDYFAVETFYQCVESYRDARARALAAFADGAELSLGDRIRAKDRRDRCLKDVYYAGHAAVQKLERILA